MGLNYVVSGKVYNISGSEYTTVSDKKHRLNYIASGQVHELGLTTDSTASKYSPLQIKAGNSTYYIGRSQSNSTSKSYTSNFASRYGYTKNTTFIRESPYAHRVFESFRTEERYDDGRLYRSESYTTSLTNAYHDTYETYSTTNIGGWSNYDAAGPAYMTTSCWTEPLYESGYTTTYDYYTSNITTSSSASSSTSSYNFV